MLGLVRISVVAYTGTVRSVLGNLWLVILLLGTSVTANNGLEISFHNGRVTLIADDIPVQTILQAWSEIGQTMFVDAEELRAESIRVELVDVDEIEVIRILLRQAAGYVAAPRSPVPIGQSRFNRVLVMGTSRKPEVNAYKEAIGLNDPRSLPAQHQPTGSLPVLGLDPTVQAIDGETINERLEIFPQSSDLIGRYFSPNNNPEQDQNPSTASRPGHVVTPSNDGQPTLFIRRPVQAVTPNQPRQ